MRGILYWFGVCVGLALLQHVALAWLGAAAPWWLGWWFGGVLLVAIWLLCWRVAEQVVR